MEGLDAAFVWLLEILEVVIGSVSFAAQITLQPLPQRLLVLHVAPLQLGTTRKTSLLKKAAVRKQFCSPAYELKCMAGRVCHLNITAGTEHCCQFLSCKKQRLRVLLALVPLYSHRRLLLFLHRDKCMQCQIKFLALFLNIYKTYLNVRFYLASENWSNFSF